MIKKAKSGKVSDWQPKSVKPTLVGYYHLKCDPRPGYTFNSGQFTWGYWNGKGWRYSDYILDFNLEYYPADMLYERTTLLKGDMWRGLR